MDDLLTCRRCGTGVRDVDAWWDHACDPYCDFCGQQLRPPRCLACRGLGEKASKPDRRGHSRVAACRECDGTGDRHYVGGR